MNRTQCSECKWRSWSRNVRACSCNWAGVHYPETCKCRVDGKVIDRRGTDPENCLLFENGNQIRRMIARKGGSVRYVEVQSTGRMPDTLDDGKQ